jgi:hypothetical protein
MHFKKILVIGLEVTVLKGAHVSSAHSVMLEVLDQRLPITSGVRALLVVTLELMPLRQMTIQTSLVSTSVRTLLAIASMVRTLKWLRLVCLHMYGNTTRCRGGVVTIGVFTGEGTLAGVHPFVEYQLVDTYTGIRAPRVFTLERFISAVL